MTKIRPYTASQDFNEICRWAEVAGEQLPIPEQFSDTTFVAENEKGLRLAVVTVLLTNAKAYCLLECLFSNSDASRVEVKKAVEDLSSYLKLFVKALKYRGLFLLAPNKKLMRRYRMLGFTPTLFNVTTMYCVL